MEKQPKIGITDVNLAENPDPTKFHVWDWSITDINFARIPNLTTFNVDHLKITDEALRAVNDRAATEGGTK